MKQWRLARALEQLRAQVNAKWPSRSKSSDGSVGDTSHSARASDHNPDGAGVVHAIDLTHDPKNGFDSYAFADHILAAQDTRLKYVISNSRIGSGPSGPSPGKWRPYKGSNPHNHHVHISAVSGALADSAAPWDIDGTPAATPAAASTYEAPPPVIRRGASGSAVERLQSLLSRKGASIIPIDGHFGRRTEDALKAWQRKHRLVADGICGPQSWSSLLD